MNNAIESGCLSTSAFATLYSPLSPSQYINTNLSFTDDLYGLNYECASILTTANWIYETKDEVALRSCDIATEDLTYTYDTSYSYDPSYTYDPSYSYYPTYTYLPSPTYATGYLETAPWLTVASSTSYESDTTTTKGEDVPTSSQLISPSPHSTVALPITSARSKTSSSFTLELSHKHSISTVGRTKLLDDTGSSLDLSVSCTNHSIIVSF